MNKKLIIVSLLIIAMVASIAGCGNTKTEGKEKEYVVVGEIIMFEENTVQVLAGDIAERFKVDSESIKNFYIGQTVGVSKLGEEEYELEEFKQTNFEIRHTNMGEIIYSIKGIVSELKDDKLVIASGDEEVEIFLYEKLYIEEGIEITVDYLKREDGNLFIEYFAENTKLELKVQAIKRLDETGTMRIETLNDKDLEYIVSIQGNTVVEFNYSELKEGDSITVYVPEAMITVYPNEVAAKKILKN